MKFLFSGYENDILNQLAKRVCSENDEFTFYDDPLEMMADLLEASPHLKILILDYYFYRYFKKYLFKILIDAGMRVPIVFYNDPDVDPRCRELRWLSENELEYECMGTEPYIRLFEKLDVILRDFDFSQCQKKLPQKKNYIDGEFAERRALDRMDDKILTEAQKAQILSDLPPSMAALFSLLNDAADEKNREVSIDEILQKLAITEQDRIQRNNIAYSYIARLRKCMRMNPNVKIIRTQKGFYKLKVL